MPPGFESGEYPPPPPNYFTFLILENNLLVCTFTIVFCTFEPKFFTQFLMNNCPQSIMLAFVSFLTSFFSFFTVIIPDLLAWIIIENVLFRNNCWKKIFLLLTVSSTNQQIMENIISSFKPGILHSIWCIYKILMWKFS